MWKTKTRLITKNKSLNLNCCISVPRSPSNNNKKTLIKYLSRCLRALADLRCFDARLHEAPLNNEKEEKEHNNLPKYVFLTRV